MVGGDGPRGLVVWNGRWWGYGTARGFDSDHGDSPATGADGGLPRLSGDAGGLFGGGGRGGGAAASGDHRGPPGAVGLVPGLMDRCGGGQRPGGRAGDGPSGATRGLAAFARADRA